MSSRFAREATVKEKEEISRRAVEYEQFIERLKRDLVAVMEARDKVLDELKAYEDLRLNVEGFKAAGQASLRTMVNLGPNIYVQAQVENAQRIYVSTGLGFHVECTWDEALALIPKRKGLVQTQVDRLTDRVAFIRSNIRIAEDGIASLMGMAEEGPGPGGNARARPGSGAGSSAKR